MFLVLITFKIRQLSWVLSPLATPERILLDFDKASISSFQTAFPHANIMCKLNYDANGNNENNDSLRTAVRCNYKDQKLVVCLVIK